MLLRLAGLVDQERKDDARSVTEQLEALREEFKEKVAGTFERQSAARDLLLFLSALSAQEIYDVSGLYYLGIWAGDCFYELRTNHHCTAAVLAHHLADKTNLSEGLINGMKRFGGSTKPAPDNFSLRTS
jgi:hypothetical protein